jgi:N6-L-threonylcarbamoyladenine synthase
VIDRLAKQGNDRAVRLTQPRMTHADRNRPDLKGDLDFSFSGLKTAVVHYVRASSPVNPADVAASFQRVVVEALLDRVFDAAKRTRARSIGIAGGVSANSRLRTDAIARGEAAGIPVYIPSLALATDTAAMIAAAGLRRLSQGKTSSLTLNASASLAL